ncbi:MAG: hypothetical protein WBZ37_20260 [Mycobacterium sp.]
MTLIDPCDAFAEQSSFIGYLVGLASVSRMVHALAADGDRRTGPPRDADDLVHVLLGFAGLGDAVQRLVNSVATQPSPTAKAVTTAPSTARWVR